MRQYELVVLYHPDLEIDLDKALKKVEGLIKGLGGKILFSENWGKRKLAYAIKKQDYGVYVYYELEFAADSVKELEAQLNITDEVIRYLVSKPTPNFGDREKKLMDDDSETGDEEKPEEKNEKADKKQDKASDEEEKE